MATPVIFSATTTGLSQVSMVVSGAIGACSVLTRRLSKWCLEAVSFWTNDTGTRFSPCSEASLSVLGESFLEGSFLDESFLEAFFFCEGRSALDHRTSLAGQTVVAARATAYNRRSDRGQGNTDRRHVGRLGTRRNFRTSYRG